MLWEGIILSALSFPTLLFFKAKPPTPPSFGAETEKTKFLQSFKDLATNKNYWRLFVAFSCMLGGFNTFGTLINQILEPFGYSALETGVFGALFILSGLFGAAAAGVYVENTLKYKFTLTVIGLGFWVSILVLIGGLYSQNPYLMGTLIFLAGFV